MWMTIVSFVFVFGIIVIAHELGHFVTARLNGIKIHEFSIGMGPKIVKWQGPETLYSLRVFPLGGFVKMEGEDEASEDPRSFSNKKPYQRFMVLVAGATMNFVLAYVLLVIIMFGMGSASNRIEAVIEDMPAESAGMLPGDRIVEIDGVEITTWEQVINGINESNGEKITVVVERDEELNVILEMLPELGPDGNYKVGVQTMLEKRVDKSLGVAWDQFRMFFTDIFKFFTQLGSKEVQGELVGPVGIVSIIGQASEQGFWNLLFIAAYISINLGIVNLLPFPALDGGRIVFVIIEMIKGKPIDREKEGYVHFIGIVILMALMVFLVFRDISNL
ncbi:MAG: RIP metalloprotease RseP [Clostridiales bacterium]|nr:RIP metalloprotease RseP [Clostridiales bacterium]